jgi:hypothetical protein
MMNQPNFCSKRCHSCNIVQPSMNFPHANSTTCKTCLLIGKEDTVLLAEYSNMMRKQATLSDAVIKIFCRCHLSTKPCTSEHYEYWRRIQVQKQMDIIGDELIAKACHPDRIMQWTDDLEFHQELRSQQ